MRKATIPNNGVALNETIEYYNERINPLRQPTLTPPKRGIKKLQHMKWQQNTTNRRYRCLQTASLGNKKQQSAKTSARNGNKSQQNQLPLLLERAGVRYKTTKFANSTWQLKKQPK